MLVGRHRGGNLAQLGLRGGVAVQALEHHQRLLAATLDHQIARAFRDDQQQQQEQDGGNRLHPEHPAPGGLPGPERLGGGTGGVGQQVVAQECAEQPADDGDLLHRGEPAAVARGGDLGDVGRRNDAGRAHRKAAHHARKDEKGRAVRGAGPDGREQEQRRGNDQDRAAAPAVGQAAGKEGADGAAQQHRGDLEARLCGSGLEGLFQAVDGAIDHAAVEAEQEATDRGHATNQDDETGVLAGIGGAVNGNTGHGFTWEHARERPRGWPPSAGDAMRRRPRDINASDTD